MKYVFFGSPRFASVILEKLIEAGVPPLALIASPDRPAGRKKELTAPPVKKLAEKHSIPTYQPEKLKDFDFSSLKSQADFFVVAAYAKIIPLPILSLPKRGTIGIHPSLLPHLRGATPIQSTILAGEPAAGVTLYEMDAQIDHGPIIQAEKIHDYKPDLWHYEILEERLALLSAKVFLESMPKYLEGKLAAIPQDEMKATFTTKFKTVDAFIPEIELRKAVGGEDQLSAERVLRKILAFSTEPGAWIILTEPIVDKRYTLPANRRIKLLRAKNIDNILHLTAFQIEGKSLLVLA